MRFLSAGQVQTRSRNRCLLLAACGIAAVLAISPPAHAQIDWLQVGGGEWSNGANWVGGVAPNAIDDHARFPAGFPNAASAITVTGSQTIGQITMLGTGSTISGDILVVDTSGANGIFTFGATGWDIQNGITLNDHLTVDVGNTFTGTLSGIIADGAAGSTLTKIGDGTLILSGVNTYTGLTSVTAGVLNVQNASALGTIAGATTVAAGAQLQLEGGISIVGEQLSLNGDGGGTGALLNQAGDNEWGGTISLLTASTIGANAGSNLTLSGAVINGGNLLTIAGAGNTTISGIISGAGGLTKNDAGTLNLMSDNLYTGATTISGGILNIQDADALGAVGAGTTVADGAQLQLQGGITYAAEPLTINGNGGGTGALLNVSGNNNWTGDITLASASTIGSTADTLTISGAIDNGGNLLTVTGAGNSVIGGILSGAGGLTKTGAGTLTLTGANTYQGATTVSGGVVNVQNATALGDTGTGTTVDDGAQLQIEGNTAVGAEALTLNGNGGGTGALLNVSGANSWAGDITLASASTIGSTAGTLTLNNIDNGGFLLTFAGAGNSVVDGIISGAGGLTKNDAGILTLTGVNTYQGLTTVSGGILNIQNAAALGAIGTGTVVDAGAQLQLQGGIVYNAEPLTLNGDGGGTGALLNVSGANSWTGDITLASASTIGSTAGTLTLANIDNGGNLLTITGAGNSVIGGVLSGAGGLTKTGAGTLTPTGANTYGGITTISAGIVNIQNATALGTTAGGTTVANGAQLQMQGGIAVAGEQLILNGTGGGTGALLNVSGANNWTGDITLASASTIGSTAGTLTLNNIDNGGNALTFAGAGDHAVGGAISGAGALNKNDAGTLTLTGENTYAGGTTVNAGTLVGSADNLNADAGLANSLQGDITNNSVVNFNHGAGTSGTYNGTITGAGAITKSGAGTLTIASAGNTAAAGTTVTAGRLNVNGALTSDVIVQNGATLGGGTTGGPAGTIAGNVTLQNGATMAAGNSIGQVNITGGNDYNQLDGSTFELELTPATGNLPNGVPGTTHDQVALTGGGNINIDQDADVADTLVNVQAGAGTYDFGTQYTFLTTDAGVVNGTFDGVTGATFNNGNLSGNLVHNASSVQLVINQSNFAANIAGLATRNQFNTAIGVDALATASSGNPNSDGAVLVTQLSTLNGGGMAAALDQLSGQIHASLGSVAIQGAGDWINVLGRRLRANSAGDMGVYGAPYAAAVRPVAANGSGDIQLISTAYQGGPYGAGGYGGGYAAPYAGVPYAMGRTWISGYGIGGDIDGDGNASEIDYSVGGTAFGIEQNLDPNTLIGLMGGYARTSADTDSPRADADIDSLRIGAYGHLTNGVTYTTGLVGYGYHDFETSRRIVFGGINRTAKGDYNGHEFNAYLEKGANLYMGGATVQPLMSLQYVLLNQEDFTETGAGAANLMVDPDTVNSLRFALGGRISGTLPVGVWGVVTPEFRARWVHEFLDTDQVVTNSFSGAPGANFAIQGVDLGRDYGVIGVGVSANITPTTLLTLDYDLQFSDALSAHTGRGGLEFIW